MAPRPNAGVKPLRTVSEATREREVFRYDPFLVSDVPVNNTGQLPFSSTLRTSTDTALTALAQLGAYQTGTARSFISLFDTAHQFVIVETYPSMPLIPGLPSDQCPEPLSLCGTAIPRSHGTCDHVLYLSGSPVADSHESDAAKLPLSIVPDLEKDERFTSRPFCQFGGAGQFYAAVPIRTRRGINIGSYCVMNPRQPEGWDDESPKQMKYISQAIMGHLESNRSRQSYTRNERMNRGLASFIEGQNSISGWQSGPNADDFSYNDQMDDGPDDIPQHDTDKQGQHGREHTMDHPAGGGADTETTRQWTDTLADMPHPESSFQSATRKTNEHRKGSSATDDYDRPEDETTSSGPSRTYAKAANIIREAFEVDGCLFYDVTLSPYKHAPVLSPVSEGDGENQLGHASSASSSDEHASVTVADASDDSCDLLGFSTPEACSIHDASILSGTDGIVPKKFLAKLLRRYPKGKIFNFDSGGELQSSDSSSEDDGTPAREKREVEASAFPAQSTENGPSTFHTRSSSQSRFSRRREGALIREAFPSARSVVFFPVWNPRKERWFAGGFVYTKTPTRTFSVEGELSFLKAFSQLVAAEILSMETLQADKSKSDALGSLSHELRSPLHGVILGTELLNDTDLSVFQGNATHTIETCCRTLLDTIDHLLDYSKVNSFAAKRKHEDSSRSPKLRKRTKSDQFGKKLFSNVRLDGLVEDVAESVFAGFNFQHMSIRQLAKQGKPNKHNDSTAHNWLDSAQAMELLGPNLDGAGAQGLRFGNVAVCISIDPSCNWMFHLQAGAIRRIVMNLFGNSLKYTARGTIRISLSQEAVKRSNVERMVKITVRDTGKGISEDYLRHNLFKPFSQEDELASGTGLGLSLVKMITSQLRGQISVESQVGVGTTVVVTLPLEQSSHLTGASEDTFDDDREFEEQMKELQGLRIRITGFKSHGSREERAAAEDICQRWFQLDLLSDQQAEQMTPDVVLWSEDALPDSMEQIMPLAKGPNVVVCQDALAAYQRFSKYEEAGLGGIFEFVSQPIAPRKFAKSILLAYRRWMGETKIARPPRPAGLARSLSLYDEQAAEAKAAESASLPVAGAEAGIPGSSSVTEQARDPAIRLKQPVESTAPAGPPPGPSPDSKKDDAPGNIANNVLDNIPGNIADQILLVDDNSINLKMLSAYMGKLGHRYKTAVNGQEALDAYTQDPGRYAGILMDISMPVMDGFEATRRIRAFEYKNQLRAVPVLALTGLASESAHHEALQSGVDVFLTKPVRLKALSEVLASKHILALPPAAAEE